MATLELKDNNLYANGEVIEFSNGEAILEREIIEFEDNGEDIYHIVKRHETITGLAYTYYNEIREDSSKYYFLICDANNIENPLDLSAIVGTEIVIPNLLNYLLTLD